VVFQWSKVPQANGYGIEIDYYAGQWTSQQGKVTFMDWVKDPTYTFDFVGDQPGSWRLWAMDKKKLPGQVSAWSVFTFGPDNQPIPPPPPDTAPLFAHLPRAPRVPVPKGTVHQPPIFDPKTGEACQWPFTPVKGSTPPRVIYSPVPDFTEAARKAKVNGDVALVLDIGEDGLVKRVCVISASRDDLGLSAVNTVRTWRFNPALHEGAPIPYTLTTEVSFGLY
jgi:TonB family protein